MMTLMQGGGAQGLDECGKKAFPKMCGAMDGGAEASHGRAEGAVFGKAFLPCSQAPNPKPPCAQRLSL